MHGISDRVARRICVKSWWVFGGLFLAVEGGGATAAVTRSGPRHVLLDTAALTVFLTETLVFPGSLDEDGATLTAFPAKAEEERAIAILV